MHLQLSKWYWKNHLKEGDVAIDATCGNGHDTLFLANLGLSALFSLDIQPVDIKDLNTNFLQMSHEDLSLVPTSKPPRLIVYNLGYLPGGDKSITTKTETTLASIQSAMDILAKDGAISITCYPGHEEGMRETKAVLDLVSKLPPKVWAVTHHLRPNRPTSPSLLWIARLHNP